jgi:hypothetical protein
MVLVAEREAQGGQELGSLGAVTETRTVQKPVYYVSEVLHEAKARYLETHKLLYAVLVASRKLHHYFQAHKVVVVTSFLLRAILYNQSATGNIAKWAAELGEFQLDFQPRHAIKSQVLADFIVEWTPPPCTPGGPNPAPDPILRGAHGLDLHRAPLDAFLRRVRPSTECWRGSGPRRPRRKPVVVCGAT